MKKIVILILLLIISLPLFAFRWGAGYNKDGLTARFWWNENIVSEVSLGYMGTPDYMSYYNYSIITSGIKPISFKVYSDEYSSMLFGVEVSHNFFIRNNSNSDYLPSMHEYYINFLLPEIEFKVPFIENLSIYTNLGPQIVLGFSGGSEFRYVRFSFYGFGFNTLGLIYYF